MTYGERIRRGREAKALTQEELAEALGVSRQAVSKWEGDLSRPAAGKLALLSETLDIPWDAWQAMDAEEAADSEEAVLEVAASVEDAQEVEVQLPGGKICLYYSSQHTY